jgi:hypothetical protein
MAIPALSLLPIGQLVAITKDDIYALPARACIIFCDGTSPTFFQSTTLAFTASVAVTLTAGQATLAGGFLKCTSNSPGNIILKAL